MKTKKALITTFCTWTSYGSILQSYSFNIFLKNKKHSPVFLIDDLQKKFVFPEYLTRKQPLYKKIILSILNLFFLGQQRNRFKKNNLFIRENLDILYFKNIEELYKKNFDVDVFISGSDQVFQPKVCSPVFFLDFIKSNTAIKCSYAASMGSLNIPNKNIDKFKRYLETFDFLSVREGDMVNIIQSMTSREPVVNIDPTFLLPKEHWLNISKPMKIRKKYYLVYAIYWDEKFNYKLKDLREKTGYEIIVISEGITKIYHTKNICGAGVREFLWLINNAEGVITSSFHGACLSIIFNKPISFVINPDSPSRLNFLAKTFNLPILEIQNISQFNVDYSKINNQIVSLKEKTDKYIDEVFAYEK